MHNVDKVDQAQRFKLSWKSNNESRGKFDNPIYQINNIQQDRGLSKHQLKEWLTNMHEINEFKLSLAHTRSRKLLQHIENRDQEIRNQYQMIRFLEIQLEDEML